MIVILNNSKTWWNTNFNRNKNIEHLEPLDSIQLSRESDNQYSNSVNIDIGRRYLSFSPDQVIVIAIEDCVTSILISFSIR